MVAGVCLSIPARAQDVHVVPQTPAQLADAVERAFRDKDLEGYLQLARFSSDEDRRAEAATMAFHFAAEAADLQIQRPQAPAPAATRLSVNAQAFFVTEPRGRVEQWRLTLERASTGWHLVARDILGTVDGLVHLGLDPKPFKADGRTLRLEDFELTFNKGTLFLSPASLGPTVLVFVGEGSVRMRPAPAAEREQLRQFCGAPELVEKVSRVFVRIHPGDLHRFLGSAELLEDARGAGKLDEAQEFYQENVNRSFLLDAPLPRSPWWLFPSLGDAAVTFKTARRGTLTFSIAGAEPEAVSLFDRARRRQICLYPKAGAPTRYNEDDGRGAEVVKHDLSVRFQPPRRHLEGVDVLTLRLRQPTSTIRLNLAESLVVQSVSSTEGGSHLFFRVRGHNSVVVSLGPLTGRVGEVELAVRYGGVHEPGDIEQEAIQVGQPASPYVGRMEEADVSIEDVLVYTNKTAWYPQAGSDDYATARLRFEVPVGYAALTGGLRVATVAGSDPVVFEYRQDKPGKYITVAIGRFQEVVSRDEGSLRLEAFGLPRTRTEAARHLEKAAQIGRFFESEFGPSPYDTLRLAMIEARAPGGHSPPGMVILARRPPLLRGALRDDPASFADIPGFFLAHEVAHQWWGHGVAGENYHERWLTEGMAQYAAALWTRHSLGEQAFENVLGRFARWALAESDKGPISLGYRLGHLKNDPQVYRAIVYSKGALVLHMLRQIVGEEAFRTALRELQLTSRYAKIGTDDLRGALEAASGRELAPYFEAWVYGTALPELKVTERLEAGRAIVALSARDLPGPVPLVLKVTHADGEESRRVLVGPEGGSYTVETPSPPRKVEVNPDRALLIRVRRGPA